MQLKELVLFLNQMGDRGSLSINEEESPARSIDIFFREHCPVEWATQAVYLQTAPGLDRQNRMLAKDCRVAFLSNSATQDQAGQFLCSVFYLWYKTRQLSLTEIENQWELVYAALFE
jgi:hypothetical protein